MYLGRAKHDFLRRAVVACAVLCLFALQFVQLLRPVNWADSLGLYPTAEATVSPCSPNGGGDPADGHNDHAKCCAYCLASARAASVLAFAVIYSAVVDRIPASRRISHRWDFDDPRPIAGWLITWSSRAPPVS
jgi:hypothetical protein